MLGHLAEIILNIVHAVFPIYRNLFRIHLLARYIQICFVFICRPDISKSVSFFGRHKFMSVASASHSVLQVKRGLLSPSYPLRDSAKYRLDIYANNNNNTNTKIIDDI